MGLTLDITGLTEFDRAGFDFSEAALAIDDPDTWEDMLWSVAAFILSEVDQQFETAGAYHIAGGFAPLHPTYEEWKEENFPGQQIMTLTGEYRSSWSADSEEGGGVIIHSSLEDTKHSWHEFGMPNHYGVLPERPVLMLTEETIDKIDEMFLSNFDEQVMQRLLEG